MNENRILAARVVVGLGVAAAPGAGSFAFASSAANTSFTSAGPSFLSVRISCVSSYFALCSAAPTIPMASLRTAQIAPTRTIESRRLH